MTEHRREVKVIQVTKQCPKCPTGVLGYMGTTIYSDSPEHFHKCDVCSHQQQIHCKRYPYVEYELL